MKHIYSRKSAISLCIALALQGNTAWAVETVKADNKGNQTSCPKDIKSLTKEQKAKLPAACQKKESSFLEENWEWVAGGATALAAAIGIAASGGGGGGDDDSHDGGDTPTPPAPPAPPAPPTPRTESFANGVVWNEANSTLTINGKVWSYSKNADGTYLLTDSATGQTTVLEKWTVNKDDDTIKLTGKSSDGSQYWVYDYSGKFNKTDAASWHEGNGQQINTNGGKASGTGNSGQIISGDGNKIDNDGDNSATNGGTGTSVDGDGNTIDNNGKNTADGAGSTGTDVNGNDNDINNNGGSSATNGGTGTSVDGDGNTIDNKGNNTADGAGSTGTDVTGDGNKINNEGDSSTTNGATGTDVDGNGNTINNTGANSVTDGATGTKVSGDGNIINNQGDTTVAKGSIGYDITGNGNELNNSGSITVDGEGAKGVSITGNDAKVTQSGDLLVTNGARGFDIQGERAVISNDGNITVKDSGSYGVVVSGNNASFTNNSGTIDSSLSGTGVLIDGNNAAVTLDGDVNVHSELNSDNLLEGATGVNITGDGANVLMNGNMSVTATGVTTSSLTGLSISGTGNTVTQQGTLNVSDTIEAASSSTVPVSGISVSGSDNTVIVGGGVNVMGTYNAFNIDDLPITGINITGNNTVKVSGHSSVTIDGPGSYHGLKTSFASVSGGGSVILEDDSVLTISAPELPGPAYNETGAFLIATDVGSTIVNNGAIEGNSGIYVIARNGAEIKNNGSMAINATAPYTRTVLLYTNGTGSRAVNDGTLTLKSDEDPNSSSGQGFYPLAWTGSTTYAMLSDNTGGSEIVNNAGATIDLDGTGLYGMGVVKGSGTNNGNINVDGTGFYQSGNMAMTTGMIVGSTNKQGNGTVTNNGVITVSNTGIGMSALAGGTAINASKGVINLTADTGATALGSNQLIGMAATDGGKVYNDGTININADYGQAFYTDGKNGSEIHNSGTIKLNGSAMSDSDSHMGSAPMNNDAAPKSVQSVRGYVVGTSANGSAGTLNAGNNALALESVSVDTGFTAGTSATTETFNDVFVGEDIQGAQNIQSASVVWTATGEKDASGNVDVTMSKNAYKDVVSDSSVSSVAKALDAGYTNNQLYNSLNLATSSDVTKAMKQISGSMANSVSRDARVLSNRFDMLADTAPVVKNGLSFNVVAQGDKRSELGNNTKYDMMALRQKLEFGGNQTLAMEYGIARINGDSTDISAGDNGLAGGYSQFFGLNHAMPLDENGLSWNNGLRYDVHQFDSNRAISYGDVNETAKSDTRQQYLELRSEGRKTFTVKEGFDVAPYAGVKLRHTIEDGYQERGAGDFNLNMSSGTETAVDSVVGMQLNYAGKNGWAATATLEGGPNLSYVSTNKKASLQGVAGQDFNVDDGQKGGGINSKAQVGVKYNAGNTSAGLEAFHWKEDGQSDKGLMVNYKVNF